MVRSKRAKPPPRPVSVLGLDVTIFTALNTRRIVDAVSKPAFLDPLWIAEALNDATASYYVAFALSRAGPPAEQAEWANRLKHAAETCLGMLAPDTPASERPGFADDRAHAALLRWAGPRGDIDSLAGALWDLRRMADYAEREWRTAMQPRGVRRKADQAVIGWIADLANIYERVFRLPPPAYPTERSAFTVFAEGARAIARLAKATEYGTDEDARRRLAQLSWTRLRSNAREHATELRRRLSEARTREYVPSRIATGEISWNPPSGGNQLANPT